LGFWQEFETQCLAFVEFEIGRLTNVYLLSFAGGKIHVYDQYLRTDGINAYY